MTLLPPLTEYIDTLLMCTGVPLYGRAFTLMNPNSNRMGAPAKDTSFQVQNSQFSAKLKHVSGIVNLKGLSHEMDLAFDDMCMVSFRPKLGTGPFLKFFRCSNDFITQKVYFSRLMQVKLIMLAA
jgi:hypothetical protein